MSDAASEVVVLSDLADLDKATELWAQEVGWREQLSQITKISEGIAGSRAIGQGGADLRMMILRQRSLIDRWVRQAFSEGLLARQSADERVAELEALFDTAWQADQRAIKRWREANPGQRSRIAGSRRHGGVVDGRVVGPLPHQGRP